MKTNTVEKKEKSTKAARGKKLPGGINPEALRMLFESSASVGDIKAAVEWERENSRS